MNRNIHIIILFVLLCLYSGCKKEESTLLPLVILHEIKNVSSYGLHDGAIYIVATGGVLPYSYYWSNGSVKRNLDSIPAGIYSITVTDAADSVASASFLVTQPAVDSLVYDVEGNVYNAVEIAGQVWMKENLRVQKNPSGESIVSYCYNNNSNYEATYGRLYTWDVAMNGSPVEMAQGICPDAWHIPSDGEWKVLEMNLGMTLEEAEMVNAWRGDAVGASLVKGGASGYEALLSGLRTSNGSYSMLNSSEYVWTSTEYGDYAWRRCLSSIDDRVGRWNTYPKSYALSVRCIKD